MPEIPRSMASASRMADHGGGEVDGGDVARGSHGLAEGEGDGPASGLRCRGHDLAGLRRHERRRGAAAIGPNHGTPALVVDGARAGRRGRPRRHAAAGLRSWPHRPPCRAGPCPASATAGRRRSERKPAGAGRAGDRATTPGDVLDRVGHMAHSFDTDLEAAGLCAFIDASPSPFHACASSRRAARRGRLHRASTRPSAGRARPGRHYRCRGGTLVAWAERADAAGAGRRGFRIVGAHTDSPNLRLKPHPDASAGWHGSSAVEVYGGALLNSWLDRDLGLSGRRRGPRRRWHRAEHLAADRPPDPARRRSSPSTSTARSHERAPAQPAAAPGADLGPRRPSPATSPRCSPKRSGCERGDILGWDLMIHDLTPAPHRPASASSSPRRGSTTSHVLGRRAGAARAVAAEPRRPRSRCSCCSTTRRSAARPTAAPSRPCCRPCSSGSCSTRGGDREDYLRALAGTVIASADMAHATHPNYADRHEPRPPHRASTAVRCSRSTATCATPPTRAARPRSCLACEQAEVPVQRYAHRTDLPVRLDHRPDHGRR